MTPDLQHALVALLGAFVVAIPLTAPHVPKWLDAWFKGRAAKADAETKVLLAKAEATKAEADARRTSSETNAEAFTDLRHRLDDCERKHEVADKKIEAMERQSASDAVLLERFHKKMEQDEAVIRGMRIEMSELRAAISGERRNHA